MSVYLIIIRFIYNISCLQLKAKRYDTNIEYTKNLNPEYKDLYSKINICLFYYFYSIGD